MAFTTTRDMRADRWRTLCGLIAATATVSTLQLFCATGSIAQVKAPSKHQIRAAKTTPHDTQADQLNEKWLAEHNQLEAAAAAAVANPAPAATVQAVNPHPANPQASAAAPHASEPDDERISTVPTTAQSVGAGARSVVPGSVKLVKAATPDAVFNSMPGAANQPIFKDLSQAFAGFTPNAGKFEMFQGRTADGSTRLIYASIDAGDSKQSYWWFAPPDQPEGWFDNDGKRLGGTAFGEPKPGARVSSPFGRRRYYGRGGAGFHNGIDFEGKFGDPIYAAADGVINHQGWYFNYGRTVKISHADNLETLYAHMSRFAAGVGPGSHVHKGDLIGYVGSTGRSTGPHLHFSTIVNGVFVDPEPFLLEAGINSTLDSGALVAFRQWQQDVRDAAIGAKTERSRDRFRNMQGGEGWSRNPFSADNPDRL
ncbi:MAG: M23 family metallopeptidase [Reyranellales bacterium]